MIIDNYKPICLTGLKQLEYTNRAGCQKRNERFPEDLFLAANELCENSALQSTLMSQ